jgi:hypothetical protein
MMLKVVGLISELAWLGMVCLVWNNEPGGRIRLSGTCRMSASVGVYDGERMRAAFSRKLRHWD